jgi:alternative ribosome-rescue factor
MGRRNPMAKNLYSSKYKKRIVKPKKGKGSFRRKKNNINLT